MVLSMQDKHYLIKLPVPPLCREMTENAIGLYIYIFPKINSVPDELNVLQTNRYTEWAPHVRHESSLCDYQ